MPISLFAQPSRNLATSPRVLAGEPGVDQARFYTHAHGSAMEAAAAFDTMRVMKLIDDSRYLRGIELLEGIVAMLTKMT